MNQHQLDIHPGRGVHRFEHRAMATVFEVFVANEEQAFAAQAAHAVFEELDRLEQELSRYRANSDITRINNLAPGERTTVGSDTLQCLQLSRRFWEETEGAFDVTVGSLLECLVGKDKSLLQPRPEELAYARRRCGMHLIELDESAHAVRVLDPVPLLDLGAVGKGYAVDRGVELLKEWGVGSALVHGGTSSVLAYGCMNNGSGWPVTVKEPEYPWDLLQRVVLDDRAISGSGIRKGMHIVNPRTGEGVSGRLAAWVSVPSAAESDAISTACMVMGLAEIERYQKRHPDGWMMVVEGRAGGRGEVFRFGALPSTAGPSA